MSLRGLLLGAGLVAFGVGIVAAVAPGALPVPLHEFLVPLLGGVALVQALRVANARRHREFRRADTGDPELLAESPQPGDDIEAVLGQFAPVRSITDVRERARRSRVREGVRSAATAVLTRYGGETPETARERIAEGTWTEDPHAAAFLGEEGPQRPSFRDRVQGVVGGDPAFQREVRHAVDAIARQAEFVEGPEPAPEDGEEPEETYGIEQVEDDDVGEPAPVSEGVSAREPHPTDHWYGVSAAALFGIGAGLLIGRAALVLLGVVGIGFAAYARSGSPPTPDLSVERTIEDDRPDPGEEVGVSVTVRNDGARALPDLRITDGVPAALEVERDVPRVGTALRPGEEVTVSYSVTARRGVHEFRPVQVVARDLTGSVEQEWFVAVETELTCVPLLRPTTERLPLRQGATRFTGGVETATGGEGIEFYATREYRSGDPMSRIDWNRHARTGELATREFRQERAPTVVIVIDAREAARLAPEPHDSHAVDRAVDAAGRLFAALDAGEARVGIAAVGSVSCWLSPSAGVEQRARGRELLATHPALASVLEVEELNLLQWRNRLRRRLGSGTQIVFVSPLCDTYAARLARHLDAAGHPVTVVSPDPTAEGTPMQRLARVGRGLAIAKLRDAGVRVIDWPWDSTLDAAIARSAGRDDP